MPDPQTDPQTAPKIDPTNQPPPIPAAESKESAPVPVLDPIEAQFPTLTPGSPPRLHTRCPYVEEDGTLVTCKIVLIGNSARISKETFWNVAVEIGDNSSVENHVYIQTLGKVVSNPPGPPWPIIQSAPVTQSAPVAPVGPTKS